MQKILLYCFRIGKPQHRQNHWATSHSRYPSYSHLSSKLVALVCNPVRLGHLKKKISASLPLLASCPRKKSIVCKSLAAPRHPANFYSFL